MKRAEIAAPAWLHGGSRPLHIAVAVILGAVAGAVAGWNLTFALLVTLALLHHGSLVVTMAAALIAGAAAHVGTNFTTAVGSFCCEKIGLGGLIESLGHSPLISLLGWHEYELLGGAMLALVLSLPAAHALARRRSTTGDDEVEPAAAPLFRPWGGTAAVVWLLAAAATIHVAAPQRVGHALLKQISAAAGAPVSADRMHYDLFAGRLHLDGVRVRDLDEPGRVALRIDTVIAELEPGLLLRGRLHAERIELAGLTYDADPRSSAPPKLFQNDPMTAALGDATAAEETRSLDPTQPVDTTKFVRNWGEQTARLAALGRLITAIESTADLEIGHAVATQRLQSARRPALEPRDVISGRTLPLVQIKRLEIVGLPSNWSLGEAAHAELVNLTSRPATTPRGVQLTLEAPACRSQLTIDFHLSSHERRHDAVLSCDSCSAADLIDLRHATRVGLEAAANPTLAFRGRGTVGRDRLELALACDVVGFRPTAAAARFGNLDAEVWRAGINRLGGLRLDATLAGRWSEPRVEVTPAAIVDQLKHQLRSVGEHNLVKAVEAGRLTPPSAPAATPTTPAAATPVAKTEPKPESKPAEPVQSPTPPASAVAAVDKPETQASAPTAPVATAPVATAPAVTATPVPTVAAVAPSATSPAAAPPVVANAEKTAPAVAPAPVAPSVATPVPPPAVAAKNEKPAPAATTTAATTTASATTATATTATATAAPAPSPTAPPAVTPASAVAELRQPVSVLDPSWQPGRAPDQARSTDPFAAAVARTRPSTTSLPIAATPTTAPPTAQPKLNPTRPGGSSALASNSTQPSTNPPTVTLPPGDGAVVISDDSAPRSETAPRGSLVGNWFADEKPTNSAANPRSAPATASTPSARPSTPAAPPAPQTASKPWFPRIRKFFGEDPSEDDILPPSEALVEHVSPPITDDLPNSIAPSEPQPPTAMPEPQTAKTPWYGRLLR